MLSLSQPILPTNTRAPIDEEYKLELELDEDSKTTQIQTTTTAEVKLFVQVDENQIDSLDRKDSDIGDAESEIDELLLEPELDNKTETKDTLSLLNTNAQEDELLDIDTETSFRTEKRARDDQDDDETNIKKQKSDDEQSEEEKEMAILDEEVGVVSTNQFKELNHDSNKMADGAEKVSVSNLEQPNLGESLVNQQTDKIVDELDIDAELDAEDDVLIDEIVTNEIPKNSLNIQKSDWSHLTNEHFRLIIYFGKLNVNDFTSILKTCRNWYSTCHHNNSLWRLVSENSWKIRNPNQNSVTMNENEYRWSEIAKKNMLLSRSFSLDALSNDITFKLKSMSDVLAGKVSLPETVLQLKSLFTQIDPLASLQQHISNFLRNFQAEINHNVTVNSNHLYEALFLVNNTFLQPHNNVLKLSVVTKSGNVIELLKENTRDNNGFKSVISILPSNTPLLVIHSNALSDIKFSESEFSQLLSFDFKQLTTPQLFFYIWNLFFVKGYDNNNNDDGNVIEKLSDKMGWLPDQLNLLSNLNNFPTKNTTVVDNSENTNVDIDEDDLDIL